MKLTDRSVAVIKRCRFALSIAAVAVAILLALVAIVAVGQHDRLALWKIVHDKCVPHWLNLRDPSPCARLDMKDGAERGTVILRDRNGVAQYLAMPTRRINGIESPELQAPDAPNLFAAAWNARELVFERLGKELPRDGIGLAINSSIARSQDQAHIHVDCLRPDVRGELARRIPHVAAGWAAEPLTLDSKPYRVFGIDGLDLNGVNPFNLVARGLAAAKDNMGRATIIVVGATFEHGHAGFLLLVNFADVFRGDIGHGEDLLDHSCSLVKGTDAVPGAASHEERTGNRG